MGDLSFEDCLARQEGLSDKKYVREHKQWFKRMKRRKVRAVCRRLAQNAVVIVAALIPIWICFQLAIEAKDAQAASEYYLQEWQEAVNRENELRAKLVETSKEYHILYDKYEVGADAAAWQDAGEFVITHYCNCTECCGKNDGITATGTVATMGRTVSVDPDVIPLGSEVLINGQIYIAEDTGVHGKHVDLYINSHDQALAMGVYKTGVSYR